MNWGVGGWAGGVGLSLSILPRAVLTPGKTGSQFTRAAIPLPLNVQVSTGDKLGEDEAIWELNTFI